MDLGQFERFRRVMHSPPYSTLLEHNSVELLGALQISDTRWLQRVKVVGRNGLEERVYDFVLVQRIGGRYDGEVVNDMMVQGFHPF